MKNNIEIKIKGMVCNGCEKRVENALLNIDGINKVKADHNKNNVIVTSDRKIDLNILEEKIEDIGFEVIKDN